jgi:hypothetical protein
MDDWSLESWLRNSFYVAKNVKTNKHHVVHMIYDEKNLLNYRCEVLSDAFPDHRSAFTHGLLIYG